MKKVIAFVAAIIMIAGFSSSVFSQTGYTAATSGAANLITPLKITKVTDLHFGTLSAGQAAGMVFLLPDGTINPTGGVVLSAIAPTKIVASYTIVGQPLTSYAVTVPASFNVISAGNPDMTVNPLPEYTMNSINEFGNSTLNVGGVLNVAANQPGGEYTGTFDVTIVYN